MRKTKKYYRELIPTITSAYKLEEVLTEVIKKYKPTGLKANFNWDHQLTKFVIDKNKLYVEVYWQGDSTDGEDYVLFSSVYNRNHTIPAKSYFDGYRTRYTHEDIRIEPSEVKELVNNLVNWLQPKSKQNDKKS